MMALLFSIALCGHSSDGTEGDLCMVSMDDYVLQLLRMLLGIPSAFLLPNWRLFNPSIA